MINKIKVLITDDSILFRTILKREIEKDPLIEVVGMASNPLEAADKIVELNPDIITMDIEMPKMDGLTFLKKLMKDSPKKVLIVSSCNISVLDALESGAVDFVKKPDKTSEKELSDFYSDLKSKIKITSLANMKHKNENIVSTKKAEAISFDVPHNNSKNNIVNKANQIINKFAKKNIIAIGASTGGTEAIIAVVKNFPADIPPIVITQHMPAGFTKMYADRLNKICAFEVREARDGDRLSTGLALVAPGDKQMRVMKDTAGYYVRCQDGEKVSGHCPSVDVLFESVSKVCDKNAIGIILTGMGKDGADGLKLMRQKGSYTIGQDKASCVVYGMPKVAYDIGGVLIQGSLDEIPNIVLKNLNN